MNAPKELPWRFLRLGPGHFAIEMMGHNQSLEVAPWRVEVSLFNVVNMPWVGVCAVDPAARSDADAQRDGYGGELGSPEWLVLAGLATMAAAVAATNEACWWAYRRVPRTSRALLSWWPRYKATP